jgi:hypothetical protein
MPRLRLLRVEDTIKPGNKMVICLAQSYTVGAMRFKKSVPTEVTAKQFEGLMKENARLGRVIFREYALPQNREDIPTGASLAALFEDLPDKAKREEAVIVPEFERAMMNDEEEVEEEVDSPRKVVGKRMTIKEGPTKVGKRVIQQTTGEEAEPEEDDPEETVVVRSRKKKAS